jgi:DNA-binding response OmpR family regulator
MLPLCLFVSAAGAHVAALQAGLRSQGLRLYRVADLAALTPILGQWRFDAVLCDADGLAADAVVATIRWLRRAQRAPIVVLAPAGSADAALALLEAGATELVDKATSPQLIALKLQRLIELATDPADAEPRPVSLGELRLDPRREAAFYGDRPLALTGGEFELLLLLAARSGGYVPRGTITQSLRRGVAGGEPRRSADMHVCRIRRKLREAGASSLALETIHGRGYALRLRGEPDAVAAEGAESDPLAEAAPWDPARALDHRMETHKLAG